MKKLIALCAGIALAGTVLEGTPKGGPIDTVDHRRHHGHWHWCPPNADEG